MTEQDILTDEKQRELAEKFARFLMEENNLMVHTPIMMLREYCRFILTDNEGWAVPWRSAHDPDIVKLFKDVKRYCDRKIKEFEVGVQK